MAADTAAKRYSAMNIGGPWRGLNVVPDVTIPAGERAAVFYLYYGITGAPAAAPSVFGLPSIPSIPSVPRIRDRC